MAFLPNRASATLDAQSRFDSLDVETILASALRRGVVSGCVVTQRASGGAAMFVDISAGVIEYDGVRYTVAATTVAVTTAPSSGNHRRDLVSATIGSGFTATPVVTAGTAGLAVVDATTPASSVPVLPALPASSVLLAVVDVPASDTIITNDQITDKRVLLSSRTDVNVKFHGAYGDLEQIPGLPENSPHYGAWGWIATGTLDTLRLDPDQPIFESSHVGWNITFPDARTYTQGGSSTAGQQYTGGPYSRTITAVASDGTSCTLSSAITAAIGNPTDAASPQPFLIPFFLWPSSGLTVGADFVASSTNVTIRNRTFSSADVGKRIEAMGAGPNCECYYGTIQAGGSGNTFVVSPAAGTTVSGVEVWIGHVDDTAIARAMAAGDHITFSAGNYWIHEPIQPISGQSISGVGFGADREYACVLKGNHAATGVTAIAVYGSIPSYVPKKGYLKIGANHRDTGWEYVWYVDWANSGGDGSFTLGAGGAASSRGCRGSTVVAHTGQATGGGGNDGESVVVPNISTAIGGGTRIFQTGHSVASGQTSSDNSIGLRHMVSPYPTPFVGFQLPPCRGVIVEKIRLDGRQAYKWGGSGQPGQTQNQHGIGGNGLHDWTIRDFVFEDFDGDGIYIGRSSLQDAPGKSLRVTIQNGKLQHCLRNGLMFSDCNDSLIDNVQYVDNQPTLRTFHRKWLGSSSSGSTYTSAHIDFEPNIVGQQVNNNVVRRCFFGESGYLGIQISRPTAIEVRDNLIEDNTFLDNRTGQLEIATQNAYRNKINKNKFWLSQHGRVTCTRQVRIGTGTENEFTNNSVYGHGSGVGTSECFKVDNNGNGAATSTKITDNTFDFSTDAAYDEGDMIKIGSDAVGTIFERNKIVHAVVNLGDTTCFAKDNRMTNCRNGSGVANAIKTRARGVATVPTGGNVTVTHNLFETPTTVVLTPQSDPGAAARIFPTSIGATTFVINITPAPAAGVVVAWDAMTRYEAAYL